MDNFVAINATDKILGNIEKVVDCNILQIEI